MRSLSNNSRCRKAMRSHFLHPGRQKKVLVPCRLSDVLCWRMDLTTNNLPSVRLNKRLWWTRWSYISRGRKGIETHFLHPDNRKKRLGQARLSDVLSRRIGLTTHYLPFESLKKRLWWSPWCHVSRCRKAIRIHFMNTDHRKSDLDEVVY
jgi:hypothetical protein